MSQDDVKHLAVIAIHFNPVGYQTRPDLFKNFEKHITKSGVFLFTVECIFQSAPLFGLTEQQFQVTQIDHRQHLQLVAPSILWLKENLINIAVKHLPKHIEYVAWIDTDIEFEVRSSTLTSKCSPSFLRSFSVSIGHNWPSNN